MKRKQADGWSAFIYLWNTAAACIRSEDFDEKHSECRKDRRPEYVHDVREKGYAVARRVNSEYLRPSEPLETAWSQQMFAQSNYCKPYFVACFDVDLRVSKIPRSPTCKEQQYSRF